MNETIMLLPAVTLSIRGVAGPDVHRELAALVGPTQAQPGCLRCALLHDAENAAAFELVEEWASRAELDNHFRSDDCRRLLAAIDRAQGPPVFRVHTLAACDGIEAIAVARGDPR
jgi:quinol monooxygenase YgiN